MLGTPEAVHLSLPTMADTQAQGADRAPLVSEPGTSGRWPAASSPPVRPPVTGRVPACSPHRGASSAPTPSGAGAMKGARL
jgi:hypothetical protein